MASPIKRQREPTYSEDLAEQIDDETGEPLEAPVLHLSQEALEEVKEHAKAAKSAEEVVATAENMKGVFPGLVLEQDPQPGSGADKPSYFPIRGISGLTREIIFLNQSRRLCQISYWASCTGPVDKVYKCTDPYHFGLCQFWNVLPGYTPKAVLYPTPKKWI